MNPDSVEGATVAGPHGYYADLRASVNGGLLGYAGVVSGLAENLKQNPSVMMTVHFAPIVLGFPVAHRQANQIAETTAFAHYRSNSGT